MNTILLWFLAIFLVYVWVASDYIDGRCVFLNGDVPRSLLHGVFVFQFVCGSVMLGLHYVPGSHGSHCS